MKKQLWMMTAAISLMVLGGCKGGQQNGQQAEAEADTTNATSLVPVDRSIYGICTSGTSTNTLAFVIDSGDTLTMSLTKAREAGKVYGDLQEADRVAVVADNDRKEALSVININTLMGDWVMPDPIDGSSEIGIRIKEGGVAEGIDQSIIVYRTWRIFNGYLDIDLMREGGGDEEEEIRFEILTLTADSLAIRTINRPRDEVETFEYNRWKEKPKVDLRGLDLEEHGDEFLKM